MQQSEPSDPQNETPEVQEEDGYVDVNELDEESPYRYSITNYGADFDVVGLVRRLNEKDIQIPTFDPETETPAGLSGFQRRFVWTKAQADRFIESLLLGLPVPGIFLVKEEPSGVLLVLDGQQRLRTLQDFHRGVYRGREFRLQHVDAQFRGKTYQELDDEDRRRLDNSVIHATIIKQEEPSDDYSSVYLIFERLNTGGTILQPQEIRVALYRGPLVDLLRELNQDENWRTLIGPVSARLKDQELILRFFAMWERNDRYTRPLKSFLNDYMAERKNATEDQRAELSRVFANAAETVARGIGPRAFRPVRPVNAAVVDSIMVGVARRLEKGPITELPGLKNAYDALLARGEYKLAVEKSTAAEDSVIARIGLATEAFDSVP